VQYQGIKGNDLEQFKKAGTQVVVWPRELKSGELKYPLQDARQ
jgi:branched-chain amino acid transport system substrate-binding protein